MIAISYRREDSLPIAGRLYDRLQTKFGRQHVFMDFDSIPAGVDFREQIKRTIEESNVVIAIIGPKWLGEQSHSRRIDDPNDFVRLEIAYALKRGIPVIPLLVDDTSMPKAETLPPDIEALAFRNALPLDSGIDFHSHADRLIVGICKTLSGKPPRVQMNALRPTRSGALWLGRRRSIAIWSGSLLICAATIFVLWRFIAARQLESTERERTLRSDNSLAATPMSHSAPEISPPPPSKATPAHVSESQITVSPQPVTTAAPTPEPTLESRLIGKWQGPRHMIEYFPDHTFAQTGLKVEGMTWRLDGHIFKIVYPDLGKDFPAWYPEPGPLTLRIVSIDGEKLITENEAGLRFVEYRIIVDTQDEREGAATRAKAETRKLQLAQDEESRTPTVVPQPPAAPTTQVAPATKPDPQSSANSWVFNARTTSTYSIDNATCTLTINGAKFVYTKSTKSTFRSGVARPNGVPSAATGYAGSTRYTGDVVLNNSTVIKVKLVSCSFPVRFPKWANVNNVHERTEAAYVGAIWTFRRDGANLVDAEDSSTVLRPAK